MAHEVETSHQKDHVDEEQPVILHCYLCFFHEGASDTVSCFSHSLTFLECICLGHQKAEDDDQDRRPRAKPVEWSPPVAVSSVRTYYVDRSEWYATYLVVSTNPLAKAVASKYPKA